MTAMAAGRRRSMRAVAHASHDNAICVGKGFGRCRDHGLVCEHLCPPAGSELSHARATRWNLSQRTLLSLDEKAPKDETHTRQREEARSTLGQKAHSQRDTDGKAAPQAECGCEAQEASR
jgi:hypothetical protein